MSSGGDVRDVCISALRDDYTYSLNLRESDTFVTGADDGKNLVQVMFQPEWVSGEV